MTAGKGPAPDLLNKTFFYVIASGASKSTECKLVPRWPDGCGRVVQYSFVHYCNTVFKAGRLPHYRLKVMYGPIVPRKGFTVV